MSSTCGRDDVALHVSPRHVYHLIPMYSHWHSSDIVIVSNSANNNTNITDSESHSEMSVATLQGRPFHQAVDSLPVRTVLPGEPNEGATGARPATARNEPHSGDTLPPTVTSVRTTSSRTRQATAEGGGASELDVELGVWSRGSQVSLPRFSTLAYNPYWLASDAESCRCRRPETNSRAFYYSPL